MDSDRRPIHQPQSLTRRDFLRVAASAGAVGAGAVLLGGCGSDDGNGGPPSTPAAVVDPPPETTTIRIAGSTVNPRTAPLFLAEQFLPAEGFTSVQYIDYPVRSDAVEEIAAGAIDIGIPFASSVTVAADAGAPLVVLAGVQSSTFEVFANDRVQSLRDIKGKRIWCPRDATNGNYVFFAALLAYVGVDIESDVELVDLSPSDGFAQAQAGTIDVWSNSRPYSTIFRTAKVGHVLLDALTDPPWSQYFSSMATGNRGFVEKHPAATKRALRAILKATDVCAKEPERAAHYIVDKGYTKFGYDLALDAIIGRSYAVWREFNPEDTMRFYALRLREAGLVKSTPDELIARATDWRYLEEIKREEWV